MEFRTISSTRPEHKPGCRSFTLLDFIIAMVLGGGIVTVIVALTMYTGIDFACLANYADLDCSTLNAMDLVTRELRAANGVTALSANSITFSTDTGVPVTYS